MSRFDRYILSQLLALFGFFSLVLVSVYWVNRAVGLFDQLIGDGQSALVFLEFTLLTLPRVIRLVLPIAAFAATVYATNRLMQDSELVVMQACGFSSFRLARPLVWFGLIAGGMMMVLTHVLEPASRATLTERSAEITENVTARYLVDGQFMHPAKGVTLYIREISERGELLDLFLADDRAAGSRTTYTARRAILARGDTGPKLIMFDGTAQTLVRDTARLSVTRFSDFTYDLAAFLVGTQRAAPVADELPTAVLLFPTPEILAAAGETAAEFRYEAHSRFAQPLLLVAASVIGFATLLLGAFSRFGLWRQIIGAILLLILVQTVNTAATGIGARSLSGWPLAYAAPALGIGIGLAILWLSERPRRSAGKGAAAPLAQGAVA